MTRHISIVQRLTAAALRAAFPIACATFLGACGTKTFQDINAPVAGAAVRFFNFGVNAPGVNYYANDQKLTAISSTTGVEATTGVAYGSVGNAGYYETLTPGAYTFSGKIAATTDKDLIVTKVTGTLENGKYYSVFTSGFYDATAKSSDAFIVEDNFPTAIDYTVAYVRFVNAISNSTPMILYAKNTTTTAEVAVGGAVAYKAAGAFVALPQAVYDLNTRAVGSATNIITRTGVSFLAGHTYTIGARGDMTVVSTTATNRPFLDNTMNR